jgi:hypothetical protein
MTSQPEIVLDLSRLAGHARKVLAHNIQKNLQKLGYDFYGDADGRPKEIEATHIHINVPEAPSRLSIQVDLFNTAAFTNGPTVIFDAATQCDDFLAVAKELLTIEKDIEGVKATITPQKVDLDATELLKRVMALAKAVQSGEFGKS